MLLFLKCHKVSLEVILENQEKNSSGCFAWSWEVSVPKKSGRENEERKKGRWREKTAVQLLWSRHCKLSQSQCCVWLLEKLCNMLAEHIFCVRGCKQEAICCPGDGSLAEQAWGSSRAASSSHASLNTSSLGRGCCENSQCKDPCSWGLLSAKCIAKNAKFRFLNAGENQAWELLCMGHCSEDAAWSEPQTAAQPAVLSFEALG